MEFVGQSGSSQAYSLLGVPGFNKLDLDVDDDEGEFIIGIRPKSSPLPRRRSSVSDEDSEPELPPCGSRRVSFADAKGLSLVQVKEFDTWDVPKLPGYDCYESSGTDEDDYFLSTLNFCLPSSADELLNKVQQQKVELETIELLPGTTVLRGVIRVLNICFSKAVYIRTTLDSWSSHFDLLAEHIPGSSDNLTDRFSFKLTLVPPFGEQGARVDFCLRYESPVGTFWANNKSKNYVLLCQKRVKKSLDKPQWENANKKSCLKTAGQNASAVEVSTEENSHKECMSQDVLKHEEKKAAVKIKQVSDDQPGATEEKGQKLLGEDQQNRIQRTQRQAARMARVRHMFAKRDGEENEPQNDKPPPDTEKPAQENQGEETPLEVPERSRSEGSLETCNIPTLIVLHDASQAHDTSNSEPGKSESFNEGDADIRLDPSQPKSDSAPLHSQKNIATKPDDSISSALSSESGFIFGTVVAPLYQQVSCIVDHEKTTLCECGNQVQATSTDFSQSLPLTDRIETHGTDPTDARGNKDKVLVIKIQETKQDCSHKITEISKNEEGGKGFMVEESHVESLKLPEILLDHSSNKSDILKTVLEEKVVDLKSPDSLNPDLSSPIFFTEGLNLGGEAPVCDLTNDLQGESAAGTAQDPLPEHICETSTCETQGRGEEQLVWSLEIPAHTSERAMECLESDSGSDGLKSLTFHGKAENENTEAMWRCSPTHSDTTVTQEKANIKYEETDANDHFKHHEICQTQNTSVLYSKVLVEEEENIVSTEEEQCRALSFTTEDIEKSEENHGEQKEDTEGEMAAENIDTKEMEMETIDSTFIEMIAAAGEEDEDKIILYTSQGFEETGGKQIGEMLAEKETKGTEEGSLESLSTSEEEKGPTEPAIKREDEEEETESDKENPPMETCQLDIERQKILEQEDFIIKSNNDDDHKAGGGDENIEETNSKDWEEDLMDLTTALESMLITEQKNEVSCPDARVNITDSKAEDGFSAPAHDVQHKQESDKENTGEEQSANRANEMLLDKEEAFHSNANVTHDLSKAGGDWPELTAAEEWPRALADEPESGRLSPDGTSSESDSDDEVELYMRCLRAVHGGTQAQKDKNRDVGSNAAKSGNRSKLLSTPMPSISESVDEEQPPCWNQDGEEEMVETQTKPAAQPLTSEQRDVSRNGSRWGTVNCENVSKTLLYATMLVSFVFVAFYYDFLACFGLYIISLIWLCCQGERQPVKNDRFE